MRHEEASAVSDQKVSARQFKAARALLGWSQAELARASGVSEQAVERLEAREGEFGGQCESSDRMTIALQRAGIVFFFENDSSQQGGAGVRLKRRQTDEGLRPDQLTSENDG